jgi:uncharacterized protein YecE (DUF72 family)
MTRFHIAAKELQGTLAAYAKRFDLMELRADAKAPSETALRRWRKQVPPHFEFCVVAGRHLSALKKTKESDEELALLNTAARALESRCVLVQTPPDVTPAVAWRDRMARLLDALPPRDATTVVWEPRGLWEIDDAVRQAKRWGNVVVAVDAAREAVPPGPVAYTRLRALGETRSFGESALARVVVAIGAQRRDAYVVIETPTALTECKTLRRLAQAGKKSNGGMGRVVRPRGATIKAFDDEQE